MNVYLPNLRLPSAYQEVEYIESTNSNPNYGGGSWSGQYINTGFLFTPNSKISVDAQFKNTGIQQTLFGSYTTNTSYSSIRSYINGAGQWSRGIKDGEWDYLSTNITADTQRHTFILDNSTYKIYTGDTKIYDLANQNRISKNGQYPVYLLADSDYGTVTHHTGAKLYSCQIYDNGTLVRDFVPCYRKSDNVIGLYDLANNQFYTNSGTGTFTKGNDVTMSVLKNAYIGEYIPWTPDASRTLLYLPLESNATDYSGNNRSTSPSNISYGTLGGINTAYNSSGNGYIRVTPTDIVVGSTEGTVSMLVYYTGSISDYRIAMNFNRYGSYGLGIGLYSSKWTFWTNSNPQSFAPSSPLSTNNWYHVLYTVDSNGSIAYINGNQIASGAKATGSVRGDGSSDSNGNQYIFCSRGGNNNYWKGGIREVIIEKRKRSAEDVTSYYNRIKAKLGF